MAKLRVENQILGGDYVHKRLILMKKGFTLAEMLVVLMVMAIIAGISIPSIKKSQEEKAIKADNHMAFMYEKAIEAYRTKDYSSAVIYINNGYTDENQGKIIGEKAVYGDIVALTDAEIEALNKSGKGLYPKTKAAVTASIKMYGGIEIKNPEQLGYSFYFNTAAKKVELHEAGYTVSGYICIDR